MRSLIGAGLAALVFSAVAAAAETGPQITVTGTAEVSAVPDMAILDLGTTLRADTAAKALSGASETTAGLLAAVAEAGIAEADVQTRRAALRPVFERSQSGQTSALPVAYEAQSLLSVKLRDLSALGGLYAAAAQAGATEFNGPRFTLSDPATALAEARAAAMADARLRADTFAQAAGLTVGPVVSISEPGGRGGPMPMRAAMMDEGAMPVAPGSVSVSAQITVVYALTE